MNSVWPRLFGLIVSLTVANIAWADMQADGGVEAAGTKFPAVVMGEGVPVLFLHGSFADHRAWAGLSDDVAAEHRFIAYTQRLHGTGSWPEDKPFSEDAFAEDLVAILGTLGEPAHVVAWSSSGRTVMRAVMEVPDLVRSVVIFEPEFSSLLDGDAEGEATAEAFNAGWADTDAALEFGDAEETMQEAIEYVLGLGEGGFETLAPAAQTMFLENAGTVEKEWNKPNPEPLTCDLLASVTATPVLIVVGSETLPVFTAGASKGVDCLPNAELATIDGVGHGGPLQAEDAFVELTLKFIGRH